MTDTLIVDSLHLATWRADSSLDYEAALMKVDQPSVFQWLSRLLARWLQSLLSPLDDMSDITAALYAIATLAVIVTVGVLVFRRGRMFRAVRREQPMAYEVNEDTIYGVDFDAAILQARRRRDWAEAVRLIYLQTLRQLNDAGHIDWQPYKTPTQYTREWAALCFPAFTREFLRVRYGGFEASEPLVLQMLDWQRETIAPPAADTSVASQEKGGRP